MTADTILASGFVTYDAMSANIMSHNLLCKDYVIICWAKIVIICCAKIMRHNLFIGCAYYSTRNKFLLNYFEYLPWLSG